MATVTINGINYADVPAIMVPTKDGYAEYVEISEVAKLMYPKIEMTAADQEVMLKPNAFYHWSEDVTKLEIDFEKTPDVRNEYHLMFPTGNEPTHFILSGDVLTPEDFVIETNRIYEISILENCLTYQCWDKGE